MRFQTLARLLAGAGVLFCCTESPAGAAARPDELTVELHAHLFMKEGLGWFFTGSFDDELCAESWRSRFSSQANPRALRDAKTAITVVSIYAHPLLKPDLPASVRRQLEEVRRFVGENPDFVLARSPLQARRALASGKRVLVLALETASGILDSDDLIREFIDEGGIRIVTLLHLTDDELGGSAFMRGINAWANPWAWVRQFFGGPRDAEGNRINRNGITERGRALMHKLIERGVWIDLSHASDRAQAVMVPELEKAGQPLLYTHTALRRHYHAERAISDTQLARVATSRGMIGLMPSEDMVSGTVVSEQFCPASCAGRCTGGLFAFATHYADAVEVLGGANVVLGSDFNGGIRHLPPTACAVGDAVFEKEGFYLMGHTPHLWAGLRGVGAPVPENLTVTVEAFLSAWKKGSDHFLMHDASKVNSR